MDVCKQQHNGGCPLNWGSLHIMPSHEHEGTMKGREFLCNIIQIPPQVLISLLRVFFQKLSKLLQSIIIQHIQTDSNALLWPHPKAFLFFTTLLVNQTT